MLTRKVVQKLSKSDRSMAFAGSFYTAATFGFVAYWQYRADLKKEFLTSHAMHRMSESIVNVTPWQTLQLTWYRMPKEEYEVYQRFKPYYIIGQIDYSKEVLIPKKKDGQDGFMVLNPLYCKDGGLMNMTGAYEEFSTDVDRAGIILNRGWIPYSMKNRANRPEQTHTRKLIKVQGTFRRSADVHDYKIPNNPADNDWHNLATEDIATFWELPNFNELRYFYFQQVTFQTIGNETCEDSEL